MPAAHPASRRVRALAAVVALGLAVTACGDDDDSEASADESTTTTAAGGEYAAYCDAVAEMEESDGFVPAQFERIRETAPEEIESEIDYVVDGFLAAEGDIGKVFADPEIEAKLDVVEAFEDEHCGPDEDDQGEEVAIAPENREYCDLVIEMDEQDGPPTEEQLERIKQLAPEAVAEDTVFVADAFLAAGGDFGKVFSDPAIEEAFGRLEAHDAEVCGLDTAEEEDDEVATEPLQGANVVPVTGVDFAFEGIPATLPAGPTSFEFTNGGESAHEMGLARLGDGVDLDELLARGEEPSPDEAEELGFTFAEPGGDATYLNVEDLEPGTYAVVCFIPGPGGKAHHELGMKTTFTVS